MDNESSAVLLVENNSGESRLVPSLLAERFRVVRAASLKEATARLAAGGIQAILLDLSLPDGQGIEVFEQAHRAAPDIPIVVLTELNDSELAIKAVREGAQDFLIKGNVDGRLVARSIRYSIERQKNRKELRDSEARFRATFEQAAVGIALVGKDGRWLRVNQRLCQILGLSEAQLVRKTFQDVTHPDDHAEDQVHFKKLSSGEIRTTVREKRYVRPDGSIVWVHVTAAKLDDPLEGFVAVVEEITERKRLEEQFRQAQKMEAIGRLSGGIAHDFNNLLTAILGYGELVLEQLDPASPLRHDVQEIKKAGERAADLTRRLLAFSRQQVLQPRIIDLNSIVTASEGILRRLIGEDIELESSLGAGLWPVKADPGQIDQVVMNLAVNSRDAMPKGGKLVLETSNIDVDAAYAGAHGGVEKGPHVMLAVRDTGIGMTKEIMAHLFEPFFTTKGQGKGTGLGMSTVYGIVKQSGGSIWVESEPGRGTTVRVYFPRAIEAAKAPESAESPSTVRSGHETVLLVEDDPVVRALTRHILEGNGYRVLMTENPEEALKFCLSHAGTIELMVTDVIMPKMNGFELAKRAKPMRPEMKILYISGYSYTAVLQQGGVDPDLWFLQKPFTPEVLARIVREMLDRPISRRGL